MIIHPLPTRPWSKVGTDLYELEGKHYIVIVDYYSNFIETTPLEDLHTKSVVRLLKASIARYGIMDELVSDNGPQYASDEFKQFVYSYGIRHITSSPLYPQANGLSEKAVQTVKRLIKKCTMTGDDVYLALLDLNNTPRDETIGSPAQRLMGRRTKTRIPTMETLLKPRGIDPAEVTEKLQEYREKQKYYYDCGAKPLSPIGPGDAIRMRTRRGWQPAEYVREAETPRSHVVKSGEQAREYRRNRSQLLKTMEPKHTVRPIPRTYIPMMNTPSVERRYETPVVRPPETPPPLPGAVVNVSPDSPVPVRTRSGRESRQPRYLNDYMI